MDPETKKFDWTRLVLTSVYVLLAALVVGGTTWYVMDKNAKELKTSNDTSVAAMQKQIDELRNLTKNNKTTNTANNTNTNDQTTGVLIKIPELGIQFTADKTISDANYVFSNTGGMDSAGFSTKELLTVGGTNCTANRGVIGSIFVSNFAPLKPSDPNYSPNYSDGAFVKEVSNKYIYYFSPQSSCSSDGNKQAESIQTNAIAALRASLLTTELIN